MEVGIGLALLMLTLAAMRFEKLLRICPRTSQDDDSEQGLLLLWGDEDIRVSDIILSAGKSCVF